LAGGLQLSMRGCRLFSHWSSSEGFFLVAIPAFSSIQAFVFAFQIAKLSWFYYISKFTDFFETFIFILLKRFDMVNLYHVVHHSIMPVSDSASCLKMLKSFIPRLGLCLVGSEIPGR
jgi:hypothetical protein